MKINKLLILIAVIFLGCSTNENREVIHEYQKIKFEFYPSFTKLSEFQFELNKNKPKVSFKIFSPNSLFFDMDSITIHESKTIELTDTNFIQFNSTIENIDYIKNEDERRILDGIFVKITKVDIYGDTLKIESHSPNRKDFIVEYQLIDEFFKLMEKEVKKREHIEYLEWIKGYFDYGLPIKKTNNKPLEYRLWNTLTSNEEKGLNQLLENLPNEEIIIFDCTNWGGIANMYHEVFRKLNEEKQILYLINEEYRNDDLIQVGNCQIFNSREKLNQYIKEK